jgi:hypothetical protein
VLRRSDLQGHVVTGASQQRLASTNQGFSPRGGRELLEQPFAQRFVSEAVTVLVLSEDLIADQLVQRGVRGGSIRIDRERDAQLQRERLGVHAKRLRQAPCSVWKRG